MKKNLAVKPSTSLKNKTGSWRIFRPVVDTNKCIGCMTCYKICPEGTIAMENMSGQAKAKINYDYCKGCGLCAAECPVKAITMIPEKK